MRVLFNGTSTIRPKSGVGHTTLNLHRALTAISAGDDIWLYPGPAIRRLASRFLKPAPRPLGPVSPPKSASGLFNRLALRSARLAYAAHFHAAARLGQFDLYHEPNLVPFDVGLPTVVTVHDLSVILYPQWHPADRVKRYEQAFARGVQSAAHILVVSETVREQAIRILGIEPRKITTVHNGIGPNFRPQSPESIAAVRQRWQMPARYLLYVGTIEPRKNLATLLRAYCDLEASLREACPLVLAGGWGWKSEPERELFESVGKYRGVRYLGYVADEDLPGLYAGAVALLYPSHYEGFGLPPVEAMACGSAAIVSTAEAIREVVGSQAIQIEAVDVEGWRDAMRRAIADRSYLDRYRDGGMAHAARFTWEQSARTTLQVYRQVLDLEAPKPNRRAGNAVARLLRRGSLR